MSGEFHSAIENVCYLPRKETAKEVEKDKNANIGDSLGCELCNIKVTSLKILQRHIEGRKHRMRVEREGKSFACELCDIVANSETQLNIHLNSSRHKNRLLRKEHVEFTSISTSSKGLWIILFCALCIFLNLLLLFKVISV